METFLFIVGLFVLVLGTLSLTYVFKLKRYVDQEMTSSAEFYTPKVSIVLPCKGLDPGFEQNIQALLELDYPDYELLFVTATDDDPAYKELGRICQNVSHIKTKILVAGIENDRAQKLNNLLKGVQEASADSEVLAFVDSDIRPHCSFLRFLMRPFIRSEVGATTGFRWYLPQKGSVLRATWNSGGLPYMVDPKVNYAWGGAMAIRKELFVSSGILNAWEKAASDDFTLTEGVKKSGFQIKFVPQCLVVSHENSTVLETLEWTNRQQTIARVYSPSFWWRVALTHGLANLFLIMAFGMVVRAFVLGASLPFGVIMILMLIPLEMVGVFFIMKTATRLLPQDESRLNEIKWRCILSSPMASLLTVVNSFCSYFSNKIEWRGVVYEMRSPRETVVVKKRSQ